MRIASMDQSKPTKTRVRGECVRRLRTVRYGRPKAWKLLYTQPTDQLQYGTVDDEDMGSMFTADWASFVCALGRRTVPSNCSRKARCVRRQSVTCPRSSSSPWPGSVCRIHSRHYRQRRATRWRRRKGTRPDLWIIVKKYLIETKTISAKLRRRKSAEYRPTPSAVRSSATYNNNKKTSNVIYSDFLTDCDNCLKLPSFTTLMHSLMLLLQRLSTIIGSSRILPNLMRLLTPWRILKHFPSLPASYCGIPHSP